MIPRPVPPTNPEPAATATFIREDIGLEATIPATGRPRRLKHRRDPRQYRHKAPLWPEPELEPGDAPTVAVAMPDRPTETTVADPRDEAEYEAAVAMTAGFWRAREARDRA